MLLPCLLACRMLTGIWLFIYDAGICLLVHDTCTGICQFAWLMVVWWLAGGLGLFGKVRYYTKQLRADRKPSQQRHGTKTPGSPHFKTSSEKAIGQAILPRIPLFLRKDTIWLHPTGHNEYCTLLLVFTHYRENHHSRGENLGCAVRWARYPPTFYPRSDPGCMSSGSPTKGLR